ncbi:PtsGHI operon antiterminator [Collibacillus ludicampi]|uniref:PtsGHI operon antiterminator n=1 Tax=Collibacillus ludicampi TaxID=2771369 RepID=A0AAV4LAL6_9BACL|nr:transcription antiterminator [Collibacillus ludicampi]GIM44872.1 PtsGHI operon antiterminator [Collibacillus ludicampi]
MAYKILKVLNNNVVFAEGKSRSEMVLVGKGIGFAKNKGDTLLEDQIEKIYVLQGETHREQYLQLIEQVDPQIVGVCEEIIQRAIQEWDEPLNPHIHVALTDHIAFAIERMNNGQVISNPFLAEIRVLYPEEYKIAEWAVQLIRERTGYELPPAEKGFITLHLHSARTNQGVGKALRAATLIGELVAMIEEELGGPLDENSLDYARLVTHLRFAIDSAETGEFSENRLLPLLKRDLPLCYDLATRVVQAIERALQVQVPESEIGYLTIHLSRLQQAIKKSK